MVKAQEHLLQPWFPDPPATARSGTRAASHRRASKLVDLLSRNSDVTGCFARTQQPAVDQNQWLRMISPKLLHFSQSNCFATVSLAKAGQIHVRFPAMNPYHVVAVTPARKPCAENEANHQKSMFVGAQAFMREHRLKLEILAFVRTIWHC